MMIRMLDIPFEKKVELRKIIGVSVFILGIIIFFISIVLDKYSIYNFMYGFYLGTGGGLACSGLAIAIKYTMLPKNQEKYKKREIEDTDERNKFIKKNSGSISFFISLILLYISAFITSFFNLFVCFAILGAVVLMLIVLFLTFFIMRAVN